MPKPTKSPDAVLTVFVNGSMAIASTNGTKPAPGSKLARFTLDWNDGSGVIVGAGAPDASYQHLYTSPSEYRVRLEVVDKNRRSDADTKVITIAAIPIPIPPEPITNLIASWNT